MKSAAEVLLKKPRSEWTWKDVWILRAAVVLAGLGAWLLLLATLRFLAPDPLLPRKLLNTVTVLYPVLLLALAWRRR